MAQEMTDRAEKREVPPPERAEAVALPRRSLLRRVWLWLAAVALAEAAAVAALFLKPGQEAGDGSAALFPAGPISKFEKGSVTPFRQGQFYLVRFEDGGFLALSRKCTHLGCTVPWSQEKAVFACPCHGSVFDMRGEVLQAPAPRPLDYFAVSFRKGLVMVDLSRPLRREEFAVDQVAFPEGA